jgi:hypothetical protein
MNDQDIAVESPGISKDAPAPGRLEITKRFDASARNGSRLNCLTCEREIPEDAWFARIKIGERLAVFCRPRCVETYLDDPDNFAWRLERQSGPVRLTENKRLTDEVRMLQSAVDLKSSIRNLSDSVVAASSGI